MLTRGSEESMETNGPHPLHGADDVACWQDPDGISFICDIPRTREMFVAFFERHLTIPSGPKFDQTRRQQAERYAGAAIAELQNLAPEFVEIFAMGLKQASAF